MATDNAATKATIAANATTTAVATTAIATGAGDDEYDEDDTLFKNYAAGKRSTGEGKQTGLFRRN